MHIVKKSELKSQGEILLEIRVEDSFDEKETIIFGDILSRIHDWYYLMNKMRTILKCDVYLRCYGTNPEIILISGDYRNQVKEILLLSKIYKESQIHI